MSMAFAQRWYENSWSISYFGAKVIVTSYKRIEWSFLFYFLEKIMQIGVNSSLNIW